MRNIEHWSPRYFSNKLSVLLYEKTHPSHPWLTKDAIALLTSLISKSQTGLEFGSGRSTIWFAAQAGYLTSVEHNKKWYERVTEMIRRNNISNVEYILIDEDADAGDETSDSDYVNVLSRFSEESLDFILVDGIYRADCACESASRVRPGGILILDNANWYLPSQTYSPASRSLTNGPLTARWSVFLNLVQEWRCVWTSNGVTDTAIYIRPGKY